MIQIHHRRAGLIVLAATVNDLGDVRQSWGLTEWSATKRLIRRLNRALPDDEADA